MVGLVFAVFSVGILKVFRRLSPKVLITACLLVCTIAAVSIYGFIDHNLKVGDGNLTSIILAREDI